MVDPPLKGFSFTWEKCIDQSFMLVPHIVVLASRMDP